MTIYALGQASYLESILKSPVSVEGSPSIYELDLSSLSTIGCPFGLALQSNWTVMTSSAVTNEYGAKPGSGRRRYVSDVQMLIPTEIDQQFVFSFQSDFLIDFASRKARLSTSNFRFCGEPYRFGGLHEYKETIYDYMYVIGCSNPALMTWVNADEKALHKIRRWWLRDFAPTRIAQGHV